MLDTTENTMQTETSRYVPVAEAAKIIRTNLKAAYPAVKFSVRSKSYSMGSSITVAWVDGPTTKQVEAIANAHEKIDRDERSGEILCGGNRFVFCSRECSERLKAYAATRIPTNLANEYEVDVWTRRCLSHVEVKANGQLLEWAGW